MLESKIEEAAKDCFNKNISKWFAANKSSQTSDAIDISHYSFKAGAHWAISEFLKELWHDASEEPNINEERQLVCLFLDKEAEKILPVYVSKTMDWKKFCKVNGVQNWYYIDDLFPKKGGKK